MTEGGRGKSSGVPVRQSLATFYTVIDGKIAWVTVFPDEEQAFEAEGCGSSQIPEAAGAAGMP